MNIRSSSPGITLLYVFALLWILMGVDRKSLSKLQFRVTLLIMAFLCIFNHALFMLINPGLYTKIMLLTMHLPTFFLFLYIGKRGVVKTAFMILTALAFSAPSTIVSNVLKNYLHAGDLTLLVSSAVTYALMLLLAYFAFRKVFIYLLTHGNTQFFLLFSLVPLVYYIYIFAYANTDISSLWSLSGFLVRLLPNLEVFGFYFLLPYIYKFLREKMLLQSAQDALQQALSASEDRIALLNETAAQVAVYRHDMRHQFIVLQGLLSAGNTQQAQHFIQGNMADLDALTPIRFCENETVNLLCSSYDSKARKLGVQLKINALLPQKLPLSDTELCSVISNGLENALYAAAQPNVVEKWISLYCQIKQNNLFIQIQNTYAGEVIIRDNLPVSNRKGHGYGCYSIQTIAQRNNGLCSFEANDGLFTLRLSFPLPAASDHQKTDSPKVLPSKP